MRPILEVGTRLGLAVSAVTLVPGALLVALARFAPWPPHWLEAVVLFGLPVACVPVFALQASSKWRHHWWAGLFALAACWFLLSPYMTENGRWIVGFPARSLAAEIELLAYGHYAWIPYRGTWAVTAAVAAVAAVSVLTWYAMVALQWIGDLAATRAPAAPVTKLADAKWASRGEVRRRFSTEGGIVLGETTAPRKSDEFDPDIPASWGRMGKGNLITLNPSKGNAHTLVFSGSGSYKTAGIAIPNALTYAGPLVVVDPKGEIHQLTAPVREARERRPWRISVDEGLDPVKLLTAVRPGDGGVFSDIAEWLLPTTGADKSDGSAFFHQKSVRLLGALLGHLHHARTEGNLFAAANRVLSLLTEAELRAEFRQAAEKYADLKDREFIAVGLAEVAKTEERQLSGVVATVANGLDWAGKSSTRGFLESEDDGDTLLARLLDAKTDIYIVIPTTTIQAGPGIARALIGALVRAIRDSTPASTPRDKLPHRLFIIDEARAMRRMDYLAGVRDEGRAHGIHLMQIFQSYQQLLECYGRDGAGAWENSVDAVITGPVSDSDQAQSLSRMIGRKTVTTSTSARQRSSQLFMPFSGKTGSAETTQLRETELIRPSELRQLPPEASIILAPGTPSILASKAIWFTRSEMQALVRDARTGAGSNGDGVAAHSADVSVSPATDGGAKSVGNDPVSSSNAKKPASNLPSDPVAPSGSADPHDGEIKKGRLQGPADSEVDDALAGDQSEGDEARSPRDHARPELGAGFQKKDDTAGEPATGAKAVPQPTTAPNATCRDPEARALAQGGLVGLDDAEGASVSARNSDHEPTSSEEEVTVSVVDESVASTEILRQGLTAHSEAEDNSPGRDASPDDKTLFHSKVSTEQGRDPDAGDHSEVEIEANPPEEHAPSGPDTGIHDERISSDEPETADKAPSQPSIAPVAGGKNAEAWALVQGRRVEPVDVAEVSVPAGDSDQGVISSDEEAGASAVDETGALTAPGVAPGLRAAIVNRAVYDSIVSRAVSTKSRPVVEKVLADPSVEVPAGTEPRVIPPGTLGSGVDHADTWSLVFVPDDGRSPVHRILFDKDGAIVGRAGPYHRA